MIKEDQKFRITFNFIENLISFQITKMKKLLVRILTEWILAIL